MPEHELADQHPPPPRVFVSYSWEGPAHMAWVLTLVTRLRGDGCDVVFDRWDTRAGSDLSLFMEQAANTEYRVLAVITSGYLAKADDAVGGVGYERKMITPSLMKDLHGHRVVPVLRDNAEGCLPRFLGTARYIDFRDDERFEESYFDLLQELHGVSPTPKPPLGKNPFEVMPDNEVPLALRHDPARYAAPALSGEVSFDYSNNDGRYLIGAGERSFTPSFSESGNGSIYVYSDAADIKTVALARGVTSAGAVGDASLYDGSSRVRRIRVGDAAILRNQDNYWAAVFVDEVRTRGSDSDANPSVTFRYVIPAVPHPSFPPAD